MLSAKEVALQVTKALDDKKGLDIKGLSKATLEKLIDWGWVNQPADLYRLAIHEAEWTQKPGFGKKSVENIL